MLPKEEGVFIFDKELRQWVKLSLEEPYVPRKDGTYLLYFRNFKCPGCKAFDKVWETLTKEYIDKIRGELALVQCTNFFYECKDVGASDTFILFLITATPQVVVMVVENGELRYVEREIGFMDIDSLIAFVNNVRDRMKQYEEVQEVEEGEGLYIELSGNWKEVVEKIKRLLFEGRNIREVCDESGCKLYVE